MSFIDTRDISAVAAELLTTTKFDNQAFDLTGAEAVDHSQVAKVLSAASGKEIGYQDVAPAPFKQALLGAGLPEDYSDFLLMIFGFLREGYSSRVTDSVPKILNRPPRTLQTYATDHRAAF